MKPYGTLEIFWTHASGLFARPLRFNKIGPYLLHECITSPINGISRLEFSILRNGSILHLNITKYKIILQQKAQNKLSIIN